MNFRTVYNAEFWHIGYLHREETVGHNVSRVWYHVPVIPATGKLTQEDCELRASLDYNSETCLKPTRQQNLALLGWRQVGPKSSRVSPPSLKDEF